MFSQQRYLVIGGSSGIGLAVAKILQEKQNQVIVVGSNSNKLTRIQTEYPDMQLIQADLSEPGNVSDIFNHISASPLGVLDGMVYAAGISPFCLLKDNSVELALQVFRVNFFSFLECCRYFYKPEYGKDGSHIVAVSSIASKSGGYRQVLYGSSKAAMNSAVRLMANELLNRKIMINAILPGAVETDLFKEMCRHSDNLPEKTESRQRLGVLKPEDVALEIINMLSPHYRVTGREVYFDAGTGLI
jgi:NAD(P)-dependent dehydrogenase (short-subunit alcohol dehydrogenase family)